MNTTMPLLLFAAAAVLPAQEPTPAAPAPTAMPSASPTEGSGRASSYRAALAKALEDAVGKAMGDAAKGVGVRSRLAVVAKGGDVPKEWFDGEAEQEHGWVQQQIAGFVQSYEVTRKGKAADGQWDAAVRVLAGMRDGRELLVIELVDPDLRQWELERFEEGGAGKPFAKVSGNYEAPPIRDNLRAAGLAVEVGAAAAGERDAVAERSAPSHRVTVTWQPMQFQSLVERPNHARPTSGPRPQFLTAASVHVGVKVADLVQGVDALQWPMTVTIDVPPLTPVERLDAFAVQLADKAKAAVAEAIYFALLPPTVLRKWPGDGGADWLVEVAMARRIATTYEDFVVGNHGSLASPDWHVFGRANFVGGTDTSCTFRLVDVADPSRIEPGITEVRPGKK